MLFSQVLLFWIIASEKEDLFFDKQFLLPTLWTLQLSACNSVTTGN